MARKPYKFNEVLFRETLWEHRKTIGHTQEQAAEACGFTKMRYHRLEAGKQAPLAMDVAAACNYTEQSPSIFYGPSAGTDAKEAH